MVMSIGLFIYLFICFTSTPSLFFLFHLQRTYSLSSYGAEAIYSQKRNGERILPLSFSYSPPLLPNIFSPIFALFHIPIYHKHVIYFSRWTIDQYIFFLSLVSYKRWRLMQLTQWSNKKIKICKNVELLNIILIF